ncbi:hypothetical protein ABZX92_45525, partial [Lentzea sp. NPDC006480]|uniref:hypothetical protein n=1 Tax=Lentzea sp. NPDC006480 TaxID=3157176 RepID=UPI0033A68EB4
MSSLSVTSKIGVEGIGVEGIGTTLVSTETAAPEMSRDAIRAPRTGVNLESAVPLPVAPSAIQTPAADQDLTADQEFAVDRESGGDLSDTDTESDTESVFDFDGRFTTDVGYDPYSDTEVESDVDEGVERGKGVDNSRVGVRDVVGLRSWGRGGSGGGVDAGEFSGAAANPAMSDGVVDGPVGSQVSSYVDGVGESDVLAGMSSGSVRVPIVSARSAVGSGEGVVAGRGPVVRDDRVVVAGGPVGSARGELSSGGDGAVGPETGRFLASGGVAGVSIRREIDFETAVLSAVNAQLVRWGWPGGEITVQMLRSVRAEVDAAGFVLPRDSAGAGVTLSQWVVSGRIGQMLGGARGQARDGEGSGTGRGGTGRGGGRRPVPEDGETGPPPKRARTARTVWLPQDYIDALTIAVTQGLLPAPDPQGTRAIPSQKLDVELPGQRRFPLGQRLYQLRQGRGARALSPEVRQALTQAGYGHLLEAGPEGGWTQDHYRQALTTATATGLLPAWDETSDRGLPSYGLQVPVEGGRFPLGQRLYHLRRGRGGGVLSPEVRDALTGAGYGHLLEAGPEGGWTQDHYLQALTTATTTGLLPAWDGTGDRRLPGGVLWVPAEGGHRFPLGQWLYKLRRGFGAGVLSPEVRDALTGAGYGHLLDVRPEGGWTEDHYLQALTEATTGNLLPGWDGTGNRGLPSYDLQVPVEGGHRFPLGQRLYDLGRGFGGGRLSPEVRRALTRAGYGHLLEARPEGPEGGWTRDHYLQALATATATGLLPAWDETGERGLPSSDLRVPVEGGHLFPLGQRLYKLGRGFGGGRLSPEVRRALTRAGYGHLLEARPEGPEGGWTR